MPKSCETLIRTAVLEVKILILLLEHAGQLVRKLNSWFSFKFKVKDLMNLNKSQAKVPRRIRYQSAALLITTCLSMTTNGRCLVGRCLRLHGSSEHVQKHLQGYNGFSLLSLEIVGPLQASLCFSIMFVD